jgi:hypothetical protein
VLTLRDFVWGGALTSRSVDAVQIAFAPTGYTGTAHFRTQMQKVEARGARASGHAVRAPERRSAPQV